MKKIFTSLICAAVLFYSCTETSEGFLDGKNEGIDTEAMFSDSSRTVMFHMAIYMQLGRIAMSPHPDKSMINEFKTYDAATDDARHVHFAKSEFTPAFTTGDFTQNGINANYSHFKKSWEEMYQSIQRCNTFLMHYQKSPISDAYKQTMAVETRFLRAFYYYHLLRQYGGVPLLGDEVLDPFSNHGIPRSTFAEVVDYIAEELKYCSENMPDVVPDEAVDYGRPTRGSALALLSEVYVLAASPLCNGGNVGSGANRELLGYTDYDINRWQKAVTTLEEVLSINAHSLDTTGNGRRPGNGFYNVTTMRYSKERILFWLTTTSHYFPGNKLLPKSRSGTPRCVPYQELVDAFPMKNGKAITDPTSGYNALKPYENRDPRFYYTFLYNGAEWIRTAGGAKEIVYTYKDSDDGYPKHTATGYYFRKNVAEELLGDKTTNKEGSGLSFIRLADVKLKYAEALTELDVNGNRTKIEQQLFDIRDRAGVDKGGDGRYGVPVGMDKDKMIDFIMAERRVELAAETGHRFFDLRRRKLFENLNGKWSTAAVWDRSGNSFSYSIQPSQQHFFDAPRMYHFPIPLLEINASGNTLVQNPGW